MIANFYEVFKKPDTRRVLPDEVLDVLSANLPRGFCYELGLDGNYMVVPAGDGQECSFRGEIDRAASNVPDFISDADLIDYAYRTQRPLKCRHVLLVDEDKSLPLEDVCADPITHERSGAVSDAWLIPQGFPPVPPLLLSAGNDVTVTVEMERRACDSLDSIKFASTSFPALSIEVVVSDEDELVSGRTARPSTIHVSASPRKAESVHDAVLSLRVLMAFVDGTLTINGATLASREARLRGGGLDISQVNESLRYWQTLEKLEEAIGVAFSPAEEVDEDDLTLLRGLVGSLLDDREAVIGDPFRHFHIDFIEGAKLTELEDKVGKPGLSLSFVGKSHALLLGAEFEVFKASVLVDMVLERIAYDDDGRGSELYIADAPGASFKVVERLFLSERDALDSMAAMCERHAEYRGDS